MSARPYLADDGLVPEHVRCDAEQVRLTHRVAELEVIVRKLVRKVSDLEGRERV